MTRRVRAWSRQGVEATRLRLGLVSNFDGRLLSICNALGIAEHFDVIVMSSRAGSAKPDPRIFESVLRRSWSGAMHWRIESRRR